MQGHVNRQFATYEALESWSRRWGARGTGQAWLLRQAQKVADGQGHACYIKHWLANHLKLAHKQRFHFSTKSSLA